MNPYETSTSESMVSSAPIFASVWLALFYMLKKNFNERRLAVSEETEKLRQLKTR
jgi:hypothetical protein